MNQVIAYLTSKAFMAMLVHAGLTILGIIVLLVVGIWLCARLANLLRRALARAKIDNTLIGFLRNLAYGVLLVLLLVAALQLAGVPSASLVAAVGAAGLAIGLALRDSLSNLAWGVLLIAFRPFNAGDVVEAGGQSGTVDNISLMYTKLITSDNRVAFLPNKLVGNDAIINVNALQTRRADINLRLPYGADVDAATRVIRTACDADARVLRDPAPTVVTVGVAEGNIEVALRVWAKTDDYWDVLSDLTHAVHVALDGAGIRLAPPQREVLVHGSATARDDAAAAAG